MFHYTHRTLRVVLPVAVAMLCAATAHGDEASAFPMTIKPGARVAKLHPDFRQAAPAIEAVWIRCTDRRPVITSGNDSQHRDGSWHYKDRAIDLRARDLNPVQMRCVMMHLPAALPSLADGRFVLLLETFGPNDPRNHFHLQLVPKAPGVALASN
jgi:hypothetical protein